MRAVAVARTNIALVKYWGKRDEALNLPAVGSLSLTLDGLETRTSVTFGPPAHPGERDVLVLGGVETLGPARDRVGKFLDLVRARAGLDGARALVETHNNFPTAAGLASSASAFAALAVAATRAAGLSLSTTELSELARRGSGSAARSVLGGFVQMHKGTNVDGSDAVATQVLPPGAWDVRLVVAVCGEGPKSTLSTDGMRHTAETSPYFPAWVATHAVELDAAKRAILARDLAALGEIAERSCLRMHASALAASPGVIYWTGTTVDGFHAVRALRRGGTGAWFTNDAGPHVKALCLAKDADAVAKALAAVHGVTRTIVCAPGEGAVVVEADAWP